MKAILSLYLTAPEGLKSSERVLLKRTEGRTTDLAHSRIEPATETPRNCRQCGERRHHASAALCCVVLCCAPLTILTTLANLSILKLTQNNLNIMANQNLIWSALWCILLWFSKFGLSFVPSRRRNFDASSSEISVRRFRIII